MKNDLYESHVSKVRPVNTILGTREWMSGLDEPQKEVVRVIDAFYKLSIDTRFESQEITLWYEKEHYDFAFTCLLQLKSHLREIGIEYEFNIEEKEDGDTQDIMTISCVIPGEEMNIVKMEFRLIEEEAFPLWPELMADHHISDNQ